MENNGENTNSDESPEFEFGSLTPTSPSQDSFKENSPADHLFFNGRLLPHSFPAANYNYNKMRSISRTTSDSEYTSRSNSTNSQSSFGCSINNSSTSHSPRTSTCNINNNGPISQEQPISRCGKTVNKKRMESTKVVTASLYRSYSSQRWQYITPAPVKRSRGVRVGSCRKKKSGRMKKTVEDRRTSGVMRWWRKILMAAIFACGKCHALEGA